VIHAAAMPHYGDGKATADSIADATRNALETADDLGAESLVVPALGCGVAGFALREGGRIICEVVHAHDPDSLSEVRLIGYSDEEYGTLRDVAAAVRGATESS
jgi:O-acetyl-ADP-ribose deacetylase (regulator of RNase III)